MKTVNLYLLLHRANRLRLWSDIARCTLLAGCVFLAAVLLVTGVDVILALPMWGLIAVDVLLMGLVIAAAGVLVRRGYRGRYHAQRMAIMLEQRLGINDSRLINAVDLSASQAEAPPAPTEPTELTEPPAVPEPGVSAALAEQAVAQGDELASTVSPGTVVDRQGLGRATWAIVGAILVLVIAYLIVPGVFHAVWPRLVAPAADHPPFTLIKFNVAVEPAPVVYGLPASITATLTGPALPDQANVVFIDADGKRQTAPMLRTSPPEETTVDQADYFVLRLDRAEQSRTFYIDTPGGRSRRCRLDVLPVPQFELVTVDYSYPAYTGWPANAAPGKLSAAGIRALADTRVTITVTSNVPLEQGLLRITPGDGATAAAPTDVTLETVSEQPNTARGTLALSMSGRYELSLTGADGTAGSETLSGPVVCVADKPPQVDIIEPPARVAAPEGWTVDVQIHAGDDVGVNRVVLHRGVNGWGPTPIDLALTGAAGNYMTSAYAFDLAALGAAAGDVITYFATAYDNYPGGGQSAQTSVYAIEVIDEQEYLEYARTQYRIEDLLEEMAAYEDRLEELKQQRQDIIDELDKLHKQLDTGEPLTDADRQRMRDLQAMLGEYADQAQTLAQQMHERAQDKQLYEFEDQYQQVLEQLAAELDDQATDASAVQQALGELSSADTPQLRNSVGHRSLTLKQNDQPFDERSQQEREQTEQDLEKYRLADAIFAQAERIRLVVEHQQGLAQRLAAWRQRDRLSGAEQRLADRLADEQALLRDELLDAKERLFEAADAAQQVLPGMSGDAATLCEQIDSLDIASDQTSAEQSAKAGHGSEAYQSAQSAADKLDSLLSDSECLSQGNGVGEMCDSLKLPRNIVTNAIKQLAQSRGLPGLGPKQGSGTGYQGSMAQMAVLGPASRAGLAQSDAAGSISGHGGRGGAGSGGQGGDAESAEMLTPDQPGRHGQRATAMPGVPRRHRREAEAYFYRLAEESR